MAGRWWAQACMWKAALGDNRGANTKEACSGYNTG